MSYGEAGPSLTNIERARRQLERAPEGMEDEALANLADKIDAKGKKAGVGLAIKEVGEMVLSAIILEAVAVVTTFLSYGLPEEYDWVAPAVQLVFIVPSLMTDVYALLTIADLLHQGGQELKPLHSKTLLIMLGITFTSMGIGFTDLLLTLDDFWSDWND